MNVNEKNAHSRDALLSFDAPSHTYTALGRELTSVTTFVKSCFPEFDKEFFASRVAAREGCSPEEVIERWERNAENARQLGTALHDKIERYYLGLDPGDPDEDAFPLFRHLASQRTLHPFRTEWAVFDEAIGLAGTIDFLERTPDGTFNLYDWKRSSKVVDEKGCAVIKANFGSHAHAPISGLADTPYWHYALQLSIYRYILAAKYGIRVSRMYLGIFHPAYDNGWLIEVPYLAPHLKALFPSVCP